MPTSRIEIIVDGKDNASGALRGVGAAMDTMGSKVQSVGKNMMGAGAAMSVVSLPLLGIGTAALKVAADYESSMNLVQVTSEASAAEMGKLGNLAKQLGADMQLPGTSAADAADAMVELSKAGMTVNDVMAATRGVLQLSTAAQISNGDAALITARSLNMFGLAGSEATRVADLLAAGANKSTASIQDMAMGLQMSGSVAKMAGLSIEDTTTALAMMANAGIAGSDAGTSLKTMLMRLMAPTDEATATMSALGVNIRDAAGNMLPMNKIITQLTEALADGATKTVSYGGATEAMTKAAAKAQGNMVNLERAIVVAEAHTGMAADTMRGLMSAYVAANGSLEGFGRTLGGNTFEVYKAVTAYDSAKQAIGAYATAKGTAGTAVVALTKAEKDAALANIFGMDAIRAANILVDGGTESWDAMATAVTAGGEAAAVAAAKSAGLTGALDGMKSNIETLLLNAMTPFMSTIDETGTQMGPLEVIVRKVAEVFGNLSTMIQQADPALVRAAVAIGGLIAVSGPAMLAIGAVVTAIGTLMSPIGLIIAGVIALTAAWTTNFGGIRDATMPIIEGIIAQGAILVGWLQTELPAAIAPLAANIQTLVGAAGALFMAFFGGVSQLGAVNAELRPLMVNLLFLGNVVNSVVQQVVGSFTEDWGPAWNLAKMTVEQAIESVRSIVTSVLTLIAQSISDHSTQLKALFFEAYSRVQQIIGQVLAAVSLIITSILGNIRTFIATHGDDIRTFLGNAWEQIGRIINLATQLIQATIVPIFQGIARFIQEHGDEIQQGLSITWNAIKGIIQFVLDLIEGILKVALKVLKGDWAGAWGEIKKTGEKLLGDIKQVINANLEAVKLLFGKAIDNIKQKVSAWLDDTKKTIEEGLQKASDAVATKLNEIKQWFIDTFNDILTWLRDLPGKLKDIGNDMIQGLIDGIAERADDIKQYIEDLFGDVIGIAKRILGIASPSTIMMEVGKQLVAGLVVGIESMTPAVQGSMGRTVGSLVDQVKISLDDLGPIIKQIISIFKELAGYFANWGSGIVPAKAVTDALAPIFSNIGNIIDGLQAILSMGDLTELSAKIAAIVPVLRTDLPLLVAAFADAAKLFKSGALAGAVVFADAAGKLVAPIAAMVTAFEALAGWSTDRITPALGLFMLQMRKLARQWIAAGQLFDADLLAGATAFADAAGRLVAPMSAMVDAFTAVAGWVPTHIAVVFGFFMLQMRKLARQWIAAGQLFDADLLAGATAFADAAGRLVAPMSAMVDAFTAVAGWAGASIEPVLGMFMLQMRKLARQWIAAGQLFDADLLAGATAFADAAGKLVAPLKAMVDAFTAVAGYGGFQDIVLPFDALVSQLRQLVPLMITAASLFDDEAVQAAVVFASRVQSLVGFIQPAVTALKALADYQSGQNINRAIQAFITDIVIVADALRVGLGNATPEMLAALDVARQFADRVQGIVGFIRPAIDAMKELRDYARPYGVGTGIVTLLRDVETLITWLNTFAGSIGANTITTAAAFAETLERIVASIEAALAGLSRLASAYGAGELVGGSWMDGIIAGLTSRLTDLETLMAYIRGLFPSSPAKHGPFRSLPDGEKFGSQWGGGLVAGLGGAIMPLTTMLSNLQSSMLSPSMVGGGSSYALSQTVNLNGTFNVRDDQDIQSIAEAVGGILSQQASVNRRMNLAWSAM